MPKLTYAARRPCTAASRVRPLHGTPNSQAFARSYWVLVVALIRKRITPQDSSRRKRSTPMTPRLKADRNSRLLRIWRGLLLFSALLPSTVLGQYQFDTWNTDNGLPQNSVLSILQSQEGYLWLATSDGLVRFDGVRFTIFNKANTKGIKSNRLTALFESNDGALWVGTEEVGIIRYKDGEFTTFNIEEGLPDRWVWAIHQDKDRNPLVLTKNGIAQWRDGRFRPYVSENGWTVVLQPVGAALVQGRALQNFYHPGWTIEPGFRLDRRGPERNTLGSYKGRAPLPAERRSTGTVRIEGFILTRYSCGLSGPEGQHLDWHKPGSPQSTKWRWPKHLRS